jgi:hypothetical protein
MYIEGNYEASEIQLRFQTFSNSYFDIIEVSSPFPDQSNTIYEQWQV